MNRITLEELESKRLELQRKLESRKSQMERNVLGQFATPPGLAREMIEYAKTLIPLESQVRFLDPAFGTGSFYSALLQVFGEERIALARGFEIDQPYGTAAINLWASSGIRIAIEDFSRVTPPEEQIMKANLLICNPPYVRHHHMSKSEKETLRRITSGRSGIQLNGLTGLYGYFILLSHAWMTNGCIAGWLIPSEFMDVKYGIQLREYMLNSVKLVRIHRFDPSEVQFDDAMVSSSIVWFKNESPGEDDRIELTYGGTLMNPVNRKWIPRVKISASEKWFKMFLDSTDAEPSNIRIGDLFTTKRGLATGANSFFILKPDQIANYHLPSEFLIPILPSPRFLERDEIMADKDGNPVVERQMFLLSCDLPEPLIEKDYPELWQYYQTGIEMGVNERYLCRNRKPWYSQEKRDPTPFLCSYMGRKKGPSKQSFRFILNHSKAVAANTYLMLCPRKTLNSVLHARPKLLKQVWKALRSIPQDLLRREGRVYGGGLHKLEPKELEMVPADAIMKLLQE